MSDQPVKVSQGEASIDEILDWLRAGRRVVVERELLGNVHEVTLRFDGTVFYCDTPTTLHRHETEEGMRNCLTDHQYAQE